MIQKKTITFRIVNTALYIILTIIALLCVLPILHTVALSFSDKAAAVGGKVIIFPVDFTLAAYQNLLKDSQFFRSFGNSVVRVILGGGINIGLTILAAYPLSKSTKFFPQKNKYMWLLIFVMMFNGGLIPTYMLINKLHLLNTIWALILPGAVPVFNVIILMNFFKELPDELDEAARMDGANPWTAMIKIFVPLAKPAIATIALFAFVGHWNAFFDGIVYINDASKVPLQTYIQQLVVQVRDTSGMTMEEIRQMNELSSKTFNAAKVFITMVPVLVVYPFLQKYFVSGLVLGSVKG